MTKKISSHSHLAATEDILIGKCRLARVSYRYGWIFTFGENDVMGDA